MKNLSTLFCAGVRAPIFSHKPSDRRVKRAATLSRATCHVIETLESRIVFNSISGTVYNDLNLSGSRTTGDPGLGSITVFDDLYNTGHYQTGDPSAVTASDGSYTIPNVPLNAPHAIFVSTPTGWMESTTGGDTTTLTLTTDAPDATAVDFGYWEPISSLATTDLSINEGESFTGSIASIAESAGTNADASDYSGTITVNNTSALDIHFDSDPGSSNDLIATSACFPSLSAGTYTASVTVTEASNGKSMSDTSEFTLTVEPVDVSAQAGTIDANNGVTWSGTVATFTDPDPHAAAGNYSAKIDYGDGSELSVGTVSANSSGGWLVTDSHVYANEGRYSVTITIDDPADADKETVVTTTADVNLAPLSISAPAIQLQEGQSFDGVVAALSDSAGSCATGDYAASLTVDGTDYNDITLTSLGSGAYSVQCTNFPTLSVGSHGAMLHISETGEYSTVDATPATIPITITDAPLTASAANISADAGVPWSGAVATFTDADPNAQAGDYTASITYADGTSTGMITSDGSGGFIVSSTLTFSTPGNSSPTVTITDNGGSTATVNSSAAVTFSSLSLSAPSLYLEQGQSYSGNIGLLTDAAGSYSNVADFSGSITWDGWIYGNLTFTSAGTGMWTVQGGNMSTLPTGIYAGSLAITETVGNQSFSINPVSFSINVISPSLYAAGGYISATVEQPWSGTVATITDSDTYDEPASYYTAATNFNDGASASAGQISATSNPGSWNISNTHTFTAAGTYSPVTTLFDLSSNTLASATGTAAVNLAQISLYTPDSWLQNDQSLGTVIGSLTDAAGSYSAGDYTGTVTLTQSGSSSSQTYDVTFVANTGAGAGIYNVDALLPTFYTGTYSATLDAYESDSNGQTVDTSSTFAINVADASIGAAGASISTVVGTSWSGTVATFSQPNPNMTASTYSAVINYNDGSANSVGTISADGGGGWIVSDTHTFPAAGSVAPSVTITDTYGGSASITSFAEVDPAAISLSSSDIEITEGQAIPTSIATLTDSAASYATGTYTGTLIVAGTSYSVSFASQGSGTGVYTVQTNSFPMLSAGEYSATLNASETTNGLTFNASAVSFSIDVADAPLTTQSQNLSLFATTTWTGVVAAFTDPDPNAQSSNYSATITYPDNTTSAGTISSDGSGGWVVTGTLTFADPGNYSPTVTINDNGGSSTTTVTDLAAVNFAPLSLSAGNIDLVEGQSYTGIVGILSDAAGSASNASNYSASLTWNGVGSTGLTLEADGTGQWALLATGLTSFSTGGTYSASVSVTETIGTQSTSTNPANFSVYVSSVAGSSINTTVGTPWYGTIATITDPDPGASLSDYTASTVYGDSFNGTPTSPSTGTLQSGYGTWAVTDTHTFTATGTYSPLTTVVNTSTSATMTASSSATVNLAAISAATPSAFITEGQSLGGTIGTLSDSAGTYATGNYTGTVVLDGSSAETYSVTFVPDGNNDGGYFVQASGLPTMSAGWHSATLTVSEYDSVLAQTIQTTANFSVNVADAPLSLASDTPTSLTATEGQSSTQTLLRFIDPDPNAQASQYVATVNWNDGTTDASTDSSPKISVVADSGGGFDVIGTHTHSAGSYSPSISVQDSGGSTLTNSVAITVADVPLSLVNDTTTSYSAVEGQSLGGTLLHFTDADPSAQVGNYSATIAWGDGSTDYSSTGAVTITSDGSGGFNVAGSHSYAATNSYTAVITVTDAGGSAVSTSVAASIAPAAPSALSTMAVSSSEIDLTWSNNANTYTGIEVSRSTSPDGGFTVVSTLTPGTTTFSDTGLNPSTTYYYTIRALGSGASSAFSGIASDATQSD